MQKMENPKISGIEDQQGELHGYEEIPLGKVQSHLCLLWSKECANGN